MTNSTPKSHLLAWFLCISWLALLGILLLSPGTGIISWISDLFGGSEITDAVGHVVMMTVNCLLIYGVLCRYKPAKQAQVIAIVLVIVVGLTLELGQLWVPFRTLSLIDILAVFIGVGIASFIINIPLHYNPTKPTKLNLHKSLSTQ